MSDICPECGCKKERDVFVGMFGKELGPRFWCGTIYWPAKERVTSRGVACRQLAQAYKRIERLEAALMTCQEVAMSGFRVEVGGDE